MFKELTQALKEASDEELSLQQELNQAGDMFDDEDEMDDLSDDSELLDEDDMDDDDDDMISLEEACKKVEDAAVSSDVSVTETAEVDALKDVLSESVLHSAFVI